MTDISIPVAGYRVNLRVAGIVKRGSKVLLCRLPEQDWWFLPGGRIQVNESSRQALERELAEEIGDGGKIRDSVLFSENFFCLEGEGFHENCVYYRVDWTGDWETEQMRKSVESFMWAECDELGDLSLQPGFLAAFLKSPAASFSHSVYRDGKPEGVVSQ